MALPLLALGRAALGVAGRTAARGSLTARGAAAGGVAGSTAAIGFSEMAGQMTQQSPASNVIQFQTGMNNISSGGSAAPMARTTATPNTAPNVGVAGDIQAATELSMDELAKQTKILQEIEGNTSPPPSAGGQAPPLSDEDELKEANKKEQNTASLLDKLASKLSSELGTAIIALGAAIAVTDGTDVVPKTQSEDNLDILTGAGAEEKVGPFGVERGKTLAAYNAKFSEISQYRFTSDDKGFRTVGADEMEANKAKQEQIAGMIDAAGGSDQDYQRLETAFRAGDTDAIQNIEDKYRGVGMKASDAYQFGVAADRFSQADAVSVARRTGSALPEGGLINADDATKEKFIAEMLGKQKGIAAQYSAGLEQNVNMDRRKALIGSDGVFGKATRIDNVVNEQFKEEGMGTMFTMRDQNIADSIRGELEGYRAALKSNGLGERATNTLVADEIKRLETATVEDLEKYTAPKIDGAKIETATSSADTKAGDPAPAIPPTPPAPSGGANADAPVITQGITTNNKAHDDTAKELAKRTRFFGFMGF